MKILTIITGLLACFCFVAGFWHHHQWYIALCAGILTVSGIRQMKIDRMQEQLEQLEQSVNNHCSDINETQSIR